MAINENLYSLIDYYRLQGAPGDQQMLIALLKEVQEAENGALSRFALGEIYVLWYKRNGASGAYQAHTCLET